jgi:surface antigen
VEDYLGNWVTVGRDIYGINYMTVTRAGLGANIQIFGNCDPRDCNSGNARAVVYSNAADRDPFANAGAMTAEFNAGFSQKFIVLRDARANQLTIDIYTSFTGRERRANYIITQRMQRDRGGRGGPVVGYPGPGRGPNPGPFPPGPGRGPGQNPDQWWQAQYGQNYTYRDDSFYQQCRQSPDPAGVIAGALIGGLLGNVASSGRTGATVAGVVVGGVVGAALTSNLNCEDRSYAYKTYYDGFNAGRPNTNYQWRNPRNGNYGDLRIGEYYDDNYGFRCAPFSQTIYINGRPQEGRGTACQQPDGTWAIVN